MPLDVAFNTLQLQPGTNLASKDVNSIKHVQALSAILEGWLFWMAAFAVIDI